MNNRKRRLKPPPDDHVSPDEVTQRAINALTPKRKTKRKIQRRRKAWIELDDDEAPARA